jgi:hypothetical protein
MMVREPRDNRHDQFPYQDHSQENIKILLDLSIKWNSLEGVKHVLKDIKGERIQVSPLSRLLSDEYTSLLTKLIDERIDFLSFHFQFCAPKKTTLKNVLLTSRYKFSTVMFADRYEDKNDWL